MRTRLRSSRAIPLLAAALLLAACENELAPQFEPTGQGELAGRLFYDVDNNGLYTPVGGDVPFATRTVTVNNRGTTTALGTTLTDAGGAFSFAGLPVGTHDLVVAQSQIISGADTLKLCRNPLPVSVYTNEQAFVSLNAKLGCVIPISQALRVTTGTAVTVAGIVTAPPGTFRSDNLYLQDPTGGIQVFGLPASTPAIAAGDSIEVSGTFSPFRTEGEIVSPRVSVNIKRGVGVPAPVSFLTGSLAVLTPTSVSIGKLVKVFKVTVGAFASGNAPINDGSGPTVLRLEGNAATRIPQTTFQAGKCYDITGVVGIFDNGPQLKPRQASDVVETSCL